MVTTQSVKTVAIIGCGRALGGKEGFGIAYLHAAAWRRADPDVRIVGVDINPENLARFGEHFSLPETALFSSSVALYAALIPQVLSVCTWPGLHAELVIGAAEAGVPAIICEKPLALSMLDVRRMLRTCTEKGSQLIVAHQRRFNPYVALAKKTLSEGTLGAPYVLEARVGDDWDIMSWTTHWFDLANYLFDNGPNWVMAGLDDTGARRYGHAVENASVVLSEYPEKHQAMFITGPDHAHTFPLLIRGSQGFLQLFEDRPAVLYTAAGTTQLMTDEPAGYQEGFDALIADVKSGLETGAPLRCAAQSCYVATETALAAYESARTRRKVTLPLAAQFFPLDALQPTTTVLTGKRVLLYADDHYGSGGREGLAEALEALSGSAPRIVDAALESLTAAHLAATDILCLYHTQTEANDVTRQSLLAWVRAGKPLALVHAAIGAYPKWPSYREWAGRVWNWERSSHPYEPTQLVCTPDNPLALPWLSAAIPKDEIYTDLDTVTEVKDALLMTIAKGTFPAAWQNAAHPHVGCWLPGHRLDMWRLPVLREGLAGLLGRLVAAQVH